MLRSFFFIPGRLMPTLIENLKTRFGAELTQASVNNSNENVSAVTRESAPAILRALRDEPEFAFDFLTDLTAADWLERVPRFDVVYHLYSLRLKHRLRVKVAVAEKDAWVHSVVELWKAADWLERECYDMFGIRFQGHPDLRRILLYDSFQG